jgi:iron complex outermembrane receptor protein
LPLFCAAPAAAQGPADLGRMSLEELLEVKLTSLARRSQSLADAPAAVFVLSREDIRRSGLLTLPEILRLVPGVQVARYSNSKWSVSARGMGTYYSNKLLVLIDGRSVYTPDFSGVYWDLHEVPFDDIERIEVIRGPGGTMWGVNAVNGIINVITRSASDTQGTRAAVTAGSQDRGVATARYGGTIGQDTAYRVYGRLVSRESTTVDAIDDSSRITRGGFRLDTTRETSNWTLQSDAYTGTEHAPSTQPLFGAPYTTVVQDRIDVSGAYALGRWNRSFAAGSTVEVRSYFDHNRRDELIHPFQSDTVDLDAQHRFRPAAGHDMMYGGEYRRTMTSIRNTTPVMSYLPEESERDIFSAFVQDEFQVATSLSLTAGVKAEHYESVGFAVEPSVRAMWSPLATHRVWGSVARGLRTPSLADQIATFTYGVLPPSAATLGMPLEIRVAGDPDQNSAETVLAYEAGYRAQIAPSISVDVALFRNEYSHLSSYSRGPATFTTEGGTPHLTLTSTHQNLAAGTSHGVEALVNWTPMSRWSLSASASTLDTKFRMTDPTVEAGNTFLVLSLSPRAQAVVRSAVQVTKAVELDGSFFWNDAWEMGGVGAYTRTDVRAGWKVNPRVLVDVGVQNLFDERHVETATYLFETPTEIARSAYVRLSVTF